MTKLQQMLTSLVAAIPAAYLGYELVMAMISYSENLSTVAYVVMGLTLLSAAAAVLIPIAVLVGGRRNPAPEPIPARKNESGDDIDVIEDDIQVSEGSSESLIAGDDFAESSEFELGDSSDQTLALSSDDNLSTDAIEEFDIEEEEEDVKPKSKKKKR